MVFKWDTVNEFQYTIICMLTYTIEKQKLEQIPNKFQYTACLDIFVGIYLYAHLYPTETVVVVRKEVSVHDYLYAHLN